MADDKGFYVGAGLSRIETDNSSLSDEDNSYKVFAGYRANGYLAFEGAIVDLGKFKEDNLDFEGHSAQVAAHVGFPLGQRFRLFGSVGAHAWDADGNATDDDTGVDLTYGAVVEMDVFRNIGIRANNRQFRLGDIARVYRGYADPPSSLFRFKGEPAIGLAIGMKTGANATITNYGEISTGDSHNADQKFDGIDIDTDNLITKPRQFASNGTAERPKADNCKRTGFLGHDLPFALPKTLHCCPAKQPESSKPWFMKQSDGILTRLTTMTQDAETAVRLGLSFVELL